MKFCIEMWPKISSQLHLLFWNVFCDVFNQKDEQEKQINTEASHLKLWLAAYQRDLIVTSYYQRFI